MTPEPEPPVEIRLTLDAALRLLAPLEDARDALIDSRHLTVVADIEDQGIAHVPDDALPDYEAHTG